MKFAAVDFETHAIGTYPDDCPEPVGVAIAVESRRPEYLSWGHGAGGNNVTKEHAAARLEGLYGRHGVIFHNAAFDLEVGARHLGLPYPTTFHDTQLLLFLNDPNSQTLALKPAAEALLGEPPLERDELCDWVLEHLPAAARKPSTWASYIAQAPTEIVAPYAVGDATRTLALFKFLYPRIEAAGMQPAYERELAQIPILAKMTQRGIPIARRRLEATISGWEIALAELEQAIRRDLGVPALNLNSSEQVADALEAAGKVEQFRLTEKGNRSVSREALDATVVEPALRALWSRRIDLITCLKFAHPMLDLSAGDGRLHVRWNSTPNEGGGARTGRIISSGPNLQGAPAALRSFIVPEIGGVLIDRDYAQQELRILAHFEEGSARARYLADPTIDFHDMTSVRASAVLGRQLSRRIVKIVVFSTLYGAGIRRLSEQLASSIDEARAIHNAVMGALPGVAALKRRMENVHALTTWGGRRYVTEPARWVGGRLRNFEYKNLNTLIQGSAADVTKTAMNDAAAAGLDLRLSIHDELVVMTEPGAALKRNMARLKEAMESIEIDVPMLSDGRWSVQSLGALSNYTDPDPAIAMMLPAKAAASR